MLFGRTKMIIRRGAGVRSQGNRVAHRELGVSLRSIASCCENHGRVNYVAASFVAEVRFWRRNSPDWGAGDDFGLRISDWGFRIGEG
jgi:hypothetical protein